MRKLSFKKINIRHFTFKRKQIKAFSAALSVFVLFIAAITSITLKDTYAQATSFWSLEKNASDTLNFYLTNASGTGQPNALQILSNGSIVSNGNVGIGTTNPQRSLDVSANGQITFGNAGYGSAGSPGIFWYSDNVNYGIYKTPGPWSGNYTQLMLNWNTGIIIDGGSLYPKSGLSLQPNGGNVSVGGNVGIGTTTPTDRLAVNGSAIFGSTTSGGVRALSMDSNTGAIVPTIQNGNIRLADTSGQATRGLTVVEGGSVGIGTASPLGKLHVGGLNDSDGILFYSPQNDGLGIQTTLNGQPNNGYGGAANLLSLQPVTGLVGIGTPTPSGKLDVRETCCNRDGLIIAPDAHMDNNITVATYIDAGIAGGGWAGRGGYAGGCCNNLALQPDAGTVSIGGVAGSYPHKFTVNGNTNLVGTLTTGPIVCMNGICPSNGGIRYDGYHIRINAGGGGGLLVNGDSGQGGWGVSGGTWQFAVYDGLAGVKFYTTAGGYSYCTIACVDSSDERLKKDITPIPNALDKILALNGVNFYWDQSRYPKKTQFFPETKQMGLVAQQVEPILPEVVQTEKDGFKALDYDKISALLVEGMKEQQKQIETEKSKNEQQEKDIKSLKEELSELRNQIKQLKQN